MALASIAAATTQFAANIPWTGDADKALLALQAVQYLIILRPPKIMINGRSMEYESLIDERDRLERFLAYAGDAASGSGFTRGVMRT